MVNIKITRTYWIRKSREKRLESCYLLVRNRRAGLQSANRKINPGSRQPTVQLPELVFQTGYTFPTPTIPAPAGGHLEQIFSRPEPIDCYIIIDMHNLLSALMKSIVQDGPRLGLMGDEDRKVQDHQFDSVTEIEQAFGYLRSFLEQKLSPGTQVKFGYKALPDRKLWTHFKETFDDFFLKPNLPFYSDLNIVKPIFPTDTECDDNWVVKTGYKLHSEGKHVCVLTNDLYRSIDEHGSRICVYDTMSSEGYVANSNIGIEIDTDKMLEIRYVGFGFFPGQQSSSGTNADLKMVLSESLKI